MLPASNLMFKGIILLSSAVVKKITKLGNLIASGKNELFCTRNNLVNDLNRIFILAERVYEIICSQSI